MMRPLLKWLLPRPHPEARLEQKQVHQNWIAFQTSDLANWSTLDGVGYAKNGFCRNPVVYRFVRMISEAAASLPVKVTEQPAEYEDHPILDLLKKPNERQSCPQFLEALYGHLLISGNAYIVRNTVEQETRELHILDPVRVEPVIDGNGWPVAYDYVQASTKIRYDAAGEGADILHLALFNPLSAVDGLSPLASAHMALDVHNAASCWNKALLDNSARPSGALVYAAAGGENLSEEQFSRLKSELEEGYSGAMRAGRPMLLEGGLDWKAMGFSPRDMDFMQAKNGAAREIALAFGVPPMLLGIPGDNTYANYQEANRAFWRQTVMPLAAKTICDLEQWLGPEFGSQISLTLDTENIDVLASDREALWNRISQADFLSDDEKREALGIQVTNDRF